MNICKSCNHRHNDSQCIPCLLKENEALRTEVVDAQTESNYRVNYVGRVMAELNGERRVIIFDGDGCLLRARAVHGDLKRCTGELSVLRGLLKKVTK